MKRLSTPKIVSYPQDVDNDFRLVTIGFIRCFS